MEFANKKALMRHLGFDVSDGRGRPPRDASEAAKAALDAGTHTLASKAPVSKAKASAPAAKVERKAKAPESSGVYDEAPMVNPEGTRVFALDSGKEGSMTAACFHCGVSLNWCQCLLINRTPRAIVGGVRYVDVRMEHPE